MEVPLVDLKAQYHPLKADILQRIEQILDGMQLTLGPNVHALEVEFATFQEVDYAIGVSDGTTALQMALMACGVGQGDEVITVSQTFIATVEAIVLAGAKPVLVDVDPSTYTMDITQIEDCITDCTRAIIPVHLYGHCADMDPILRIARDRGLWVIEDACQAHGARYRGRRAGSLGHIAAYSFYCSKNLGAYGEAGMLTTDDEELANRVRLMRDHGAPRRYHHELIGMNARLDEIQAAVLRAKLPYLEAWNRRRREHAAHYKALLIGVAGIVPPVAADYAEHVYHQYVVLASQRDELVEHLHQCGIGAGIHYPIPCHLQPALEHLGYDRGDLPVTEQIADRTLSLPMYAELSPQQQEYVVDTIRDFYAGSASNRQ
jgi:dTDP-4-amino-4,6-dideoxygalactose transaminase